MNKCPFLKGKYINHRNGETEEFQYCIKDDCMAYDEEHDSCKLIECKKFQFIN